MGRNRQLIAKTPKNESPVDTTPQPTRLIFKPDVWLRPSSDGRCYEYVDVYVDDLMFAIDHPKDFEKLLRETYNFKLKRTGEIEYHIGMDFFRDKDGTLCIKPALIWCAS